MNPPPPMFPAAGRVTVSAKPTATAASTAFPPRFMMSAPTLLAISLLLTTIACFARTARSPARKCHAGGNAARSRDGMAGVGPRDAIAHPAIPSATAANAVTPVRAIIPVLTPVSKEMAVVAHVDVLRPKRERDGATSLVSH